jgi:integrase
MRPSETKEGRADERRVATYLNRWIDRYLSEHRLVLARTQDPLPSLWLSVEKNFSRTTKALVGIDISPHLFRAAGVSTAAMYAGDIPHLGSALLHHTDPSVTEEHYNRATGLSAAQSFGALIRKLRAP